MNNPTIYVSVPNYYDKEIYRTIDDIYSLSTHPENIYVGLAHTIDYMDRNYLYEVQKHLYKYERLSNVFINKKHSVGVGYGRLAAASRYNGQDYYLQIDSHTMFMPGWDEQLIDSYKHAQEEFLNKDIVLTGYLPAYQYVDKNTREFVGSKYPMYPKFTAGTELDEKDSHDSRQQHWNKVYYRIPKWITHNDNFESVDKDYLLCRKINANFIFASGKFAKNYRKYFPWSYIFFEEEFIMSIEAFDDNFLFVYPNKELPLAHLYLNHFNKFYTRVSAEPAEKDFLTATRHINRYLDKKDNADKIKRYCEYAGLTYPEMNSIDIDYVPTWEGR